MEYFIKFLDKIIYRILDKILGGILDSILQRTYRGLLNSNYPHFAPEETQTRLFLFSNMEKPNGFPFELTRKWERINSYKTSQKKKHRRFEISFNNCLEKLSGSQIFWLDIFGKTIKLNLGTMPGSAEGQLLCFRFFFNVSSDIPNWDISSLTFSKMTIDRLLSKKFKIKSRLFKNYSKAWNKNFYEIVLTRIFKSAGMIQTVVRTQYYYK